MRPAPLALIDSLILIVAIAIAMVPLLPVYGDLVAVPAIVGGLAIGFVAAALPAWRSAPKLYSVVLATVGYFLFGSVLAIPTAALFGVFPNVDTLRSLAVGIVSAWKQTLTVQIPLGNAGSFLIVPFLLSLLGAVVATTICWRSTKNGLALTAALVPLLVLGVSMVLGTATVVAAPLLGTILAILLAGWSSWRIGNLEPRRALSIGVTLTLVASTGVIGGPALVDGLQRLVVRDHINPPFDLRDYPSPLSAFRQYIKDRKDTELLTVRGLPSDGIIRLATMDSFDGVVWNVAGNSGSEGSGEFRRVGSSIPNRSPGELMDVDITIHELTGVWVPTVGQPTQFAFNNGDTVELASTLRYNDATGTAVLPSRLARGQHYTLSTYWTKPPTDRVIGNARASSVALPKPQNVPEAVESQASDIAGAASSPVLIARALEETLHDEGFFSHGLKSEGDYPSLSGHGASRIQALLGDDIMVGDSEQYASAMALMARRMGLPARVVLGFKPPDEGKSGAEITIVGNDITAWVEIGFEGFGWVPFFPTPPESQTPHERMDELVPKPNPQVVQPPPPVIAPPDTPDQFTDEAETTDDDPLTSSFNWLPVLIGIGIGLIPLILAGFPLLLIILAKRRRRRRRATTTDPSLSISGGWRELLDQASDLRRIVSPATTRLEKARELSATFPDGDLVPVLARLARRADAASFDQASTTSSEATDYWTDVTGAVSMMLVDVSRRQRLRAKISLISLRRAKAERKARAKAERKARTEREPRVHRPGVDAPGQATTTTEPSRDPAQ